MKCDLEINALKELYQNFYAEHPFTVFSEEPIFLKQVVNTNKCVISIEKSGDTIVVHSAIDNLIKGAVGQALQNMNIMFGLNETMGLMLKSIAF